MPLFQLTVPVFFPDHHTIPAHIVNCCCVSYDVLHVYIAHVPLTGLSSIEVGSGHCM